VSGGGRVLYIDDDSALVLLARRKLSRLGYEVTGFTDPKAAIERFDSDPSAFDAVVTDLSMPYASGFELARRMRRTRPDLPVIVTSGYVTEDDEATAREIGVRALLLKPRTMDELGDALARALALP
jgi:CheY-like chemotaxis protein